MLTCKKWNSEFEDYDDIELTKELAETLRKSAIEFTEVINSYIKARAKIDNDFNGFL